MDDILNDLRCMLDDRLPHPLEGGKSASDDDNELNEIIVLEKTIALLENNPGSSGSDLGNIHKLIGLWIKNGR